MVTSPNERDADCNARGILVSFLLLNWRRRILIAQSARLAPVLCPSNAEVVLNDTRFFLIEVRNRPWILNWVDRET